MEIQKAYIDFQQYSALKQEDHNLHIKCLKVKLKSMSYQITKNGMYGTEKRKTALPVIQN